jgi:hypothetical protein
MGYTIWLERPAGKEWASISGISEYIWNEEIVQHDGTMQ